ncbi:MAG: hypothetical protein HN413_05160 [Chloroflexi bacterium]|nr:hypothetical protein [Chloroflexota bacterium]
MANKFTFHTFNPQKIIPIIFILAAAFLWAGCSPVGKDADQPESDLEYLTPTKITVNGMTFETSASLSTTEFTFSILAEMPAEAMSAIDMFGDSPPLFSEATFTNIETGEDLVFEPYAGGGGGGEGSSTISMEQETLYRVQMPLEKGQVIKIKALVTFAAYIGLTQPVPFEFELTVE